jgi:hypothetical protein
MELQNGRLAEQSAGSATWKWAAGAIVLLLFSWSLRYAESILRRPRLAAKIAELNAYKEKLPKVERELAFLQFLKTNQAPYLEPIYLMANAAPPGTKFESISITPHGDFALRANMRDAQQVVDFRAKLLVSGFFPNVVVEEQTPSGNPQKTVVRITGQWIASDERKPLPEPEKSSPRGAGAMPMEASFAPGPGGETIVMPNNAPPLNRPTATRRTRVPPTE